LVGKVRINVLLVVSVGIKIGLGHVWGDTGLVVGKSLVLIERRSWLDGVVGEVFVGIGSLTRCAAHSKFYQSSIKYLN
jgi:hypothetical protein